MSEKTERVTETEALSICGTALEGLEPEAAARIIAYLQMRFGGAPIRQSRERTMITETEELKAWDQRNRAYAKVVDGTTAGQLLIKNNFLWCLVSRMLPHMPADIKTAIEVDLGFAEWEDYVKADEYELAAAKGEADRIQNGLRDLEPRQ